MRRLLAIGIIALGCHGIANAALDLELTQGMDQSVPIGINNFDSNLTITGDATLASVIRHDLATSGRFRAIDPAANPAAKLDDILTGSVTNLGDGRYRINAQLSSVYGQAAGGSHKSQVLFAKTYTVPQNQLRSAAHHISDDIFQKLTGIPGIFSTHLAYVLVSKNNGRKYYTLELSDADGFNPRPMLRSVQPIMSPAWRPDGRHLYYVSFEGFKARIFDQDIMTGQRRIVSSYQGINGAPAVSPDGKKMALVLSKTGNPKIYLMDMHNGRLQQITKGPSIDTEPAWLPDQSGFLFTSNRGGGPQIYKYTLATGTIQRMTYQGNYNARARVLPDGKGFVMMHRDSTMFGIAKQVDGDCDVLVRAGSDESPSLAPNGQMIIYATEVRGRGVLAMVSIDGRIRLTLPAREGSVQEPAWSPYARA